MNSNTRSALLVAGLAGATLLTAGCSDRNSTDTVGQKMDRATDRVAAATDHATTKAATAMDDTAITTKVKAAIVADPKLSALQISVDTKGAVVTLSGNVDNASAREEALRVARDVTGVQTVIDNLVIKTAQN
jgi:hyperosmotically inducible periplasmic protein